MVQDPNARGRTPMTIKVGINGFGRIGRNFFRAAKERGADIDFVAANDLLSVELMAHLLKYDTILGTYRGDVEVVGDGIKVDGDTLRILAERDPTALPWGELGVDVVVESSGLFTSRDKAAQHLEAGAPLVVISAPGKDVAATFVGDGSITDFTAILAREVTAAEVRDAFRDASESGPLSGGILVYSEAPIVSSDIVGSPASCTFDAPLAMAIGNLVKVMGWYDNEWGYSNRLVDLVKLVGTSNSNANSKKK